MSFSLSLSLGAVLTGYIHRLAYREGVTIGVIAPQSGGFLQGLSTAFSLGAAHKLEKGAIVADAVALHVRVSMSGSASVSTQIAALRKLLLPPAGERNEFAASVVQVCTVSSFQLTL